MTATLEGKVAVVTGASRGIGLTTAHRLAERGASLFLAADGPREELETAAAACRSRNPAGGDTRFGLYDLAEIGAAEAMIEAAVEAFGRIDILINNAAVRVRKPFGAFTHADYDDVMNVNVRSIFFACQAAVPVMREAGGGRIINVASQRATAAKQNLALYGMSKAAVVYLTRAMAVELAREGITVNAVSPGPIETRYTLDRFAKQPELRQNYLNDVPQGRLGRPDEVAEAILFLATSEGTFIQGHNLLVDGGNVLW